MTKAESAASGLRSILIATAVAGVLGYAIQLLAPALLQDDASYVTFSVYWSTLYLCVAALSGIQQEITRASRPSVGQLETGVLRQFTLIAVAAVVVVLAVLALLFGRAILPGSTILLALSLILGVVGYLFVAVLSGVFYGLRLWRDVALLTIVDAGLRAALVLTALAANWSPELVALAVSLPFGLAFAATWWRTRRSVVGAFRLDVGLSRLVANTGGTIAAAAAMGVMMNGLPMLLGIAADGAATAQLAGLILAITITRAPIVIPLLAMQSYLISLLRGADEVVRRRVLISLAAGFIAVGVLAGAAALFGPWVIAFVSAGRFDIESSMMAAITASAGLVALMCITGPALLGESRHAPYAAGWVVAAALTVATLFLPLALEPKLALLLLLPPFGGLIVHLVALWRRRPLVLQQTDSI